MHIRTILQKKLSDFARGIAIQVVNRGESADFSAFRPITNQTVTEGMTANYSHVPTFPILVIGSEDEDGSEAV